MHQFVHIDADQNPYLSRPFNIRTDPKIARSIKVTHQCIEEVNLPMVKNVFYFI